MVFKIVNVEKIEIGQWQDLGGGMVFRDAIWFNIILSWLNKI